MLKKLQDNPKFSRESLIRQPVGSYVETGDISGALNEALKYSDTRYIDNRKSSVKKLKTPDGNCFQAVCMLKRKYGVQDKFLIYDINDGTDGSIPFVLNSSRQKVDLLHNLDRHDLIHLLWRLCILMLFIITQKDGRHIHCLTTTYD